MPVSADLITLCLQIVKCSTLPGADFDEMCLQKFEVQHVVFASIPRHSPRLMNSVSNPPPNKCEILYQLNFIRGSTVSKKFDDEYDDK